MSSKHTAPPTAQCLPHRFTASLFSLADEADGDGSAKLGTLGFDPPPGMINDKPIVQSACAMEGVLVGGWFGWRGIGWEDG
jgi:hypothetical protein